LSVYWRGHSSANPTPHQLINSSFCHLLPSLFQLAAFLGAAGVVVMCVMEQEEEEEEE
jgi:hypothetical protein